jgi:hypothetical protein
MVMEPLRGGALATKLPKEATRFYDNAKIKRSPAEWGLRWVWNHPEVTLALSGMNDEAQVAENIKTAETALPYSMKPGELAIIRNVVDTYRQMLKVQCTGCHYCMPCPNGVNIPRNFAAYNDYYMFGEEQTTRGMYAMMLMGGLTGVRSDAALCKDCKTCMQLCPQHIEIPQKLKDVANIFGGTKTEAKLAAAKQAQKQKPAKPQ